MNNFDEIFPKIKQNIENLIEDEEGNIPGKKLLVLGTMVVILGNLLSTEVFAAHRSHSSHQSHSSHRSGSSSHESHVSHQSHTSSTHGNSHSNHSNHQSHTSHSNTSAHSNSIYSAEGDVTYSAPKAASVPTVKSTPVAVTAETFKLPDVNQNIEVPNGTPTTSIIPVLAVPASTPVSKVDASELHQPSTTEKVE